ncbi:MAG: hypothetical protein LQ337_006746 [Flavoplaca oasis]|nr:MAG: hypothetical protein LQ337_006746 [Flavoplaca oasis]
MYQNLCLFGYAALFSFTPGTLAAPGFSNVNLDKRWFTLNPSPEAGGTRPWPGHKLKYKFKDDNSKSKLGDIVKAGWKLWTDNGVDKANIDIEESPGSPDQDVLVIQVTSEPKAITTVGSSARPQMQFGDSDSYGLLDKNANMAHELGHSLGFYHEHQRDDRDDHVVFNCKNLQDWSEDKEKDGFCTDLMAAKQEGWSSLDWIIFPRSDQNPPLCEQSDAYDEDSIMHYPGGAGAKKPFLGHRNTVLGKKDNPDESFKKNMKPSSADVNRANAMYSTPENKKRDITKACSDQPPAEQPAPEEPVPEGDEDDQEDAEEDAEEEQEDAEEDAEDAEEEAEDD